MITNRRTTHKTLHPMAHADPAAHNLYLGALVQSKRVFLGRSGRRELKKKPDHGAMKTCQFLWKYRGCPGLLTPRKEDTRFNPEAPTPNLRQPQ